MRLIISSLTINDMQKTHYVQMIPDQSQLVGQAFMAPTSMIMKPHRAFTCFTNKQYQPHQSTKIMFYGVSEPQMRESFGRGFGAKI
jgi:hypothetical protein